MKHYHFAQISSLALVALFAGAPSLVAQEQVPAQTNKQQAQSQPGRAQQQAQVFNFIRVVAGSDLIGKPVHDKDGLLVGEVEYLLIDPITGKVGDAVVGPGSILSEQNRMQGLRAIPWDQIAKDFSNTGEIRTLSLQVARNELERAPMVDAKALDRVTSPQYQALVRNYYLPIIPQSGNQPSQAPEPSDQTGSLRSNQPSTGGQDIAQSGQPPAAPDAQSNQPTSNMEALDDSGKTGTQSGPSPEQDQQANRQGTDMEALEQTGQAGTQGGPAPEQPAGSSAQASKQQGSSAQPNGYVLIGRSIVTTLMPPEFRLARQLRGANVVSADGQELGQIDRFIIDADRGQVAYVLIAQGGFLGSGETLRPVPLQALRWQGGETFRIGVNAVNFAQLPPMIGEWTPKRVIRADLEQLYRAFGLKPYWQAS